MIAFFAEDRTEKSGRELIKTLAKRLTDTKPLFTSDELSTYKTLLLEQYHDMIVFSYVQHKKRGRPAIGKEIIDIVIRLAKENNWGYKRIVGELKKLSIKVSRTSIQNILNANHIEQNAHAARSHMEEIHRVAHEYLDSM